MQGSTPKSSCLGGQIPRQVHDQIDNLDLENHIDLTLADWLKAKDCVLSLANQLKITPLPDSDSWLNYIEHIQGRILYLKSDCDWLRSQIAKREAKREAKKAELARLIDEAKAERAKSAFAFHELQQKYFEFQAEKSKRDKIIENLNAKLGEPAARPDNSGLPPSIDFNKKSSDSDGGDKKKKKRKMAKGKLGPKKGHKPRARKPAPK
ncbi:MAG: hypothetical protein LBE49_09575 [Deltaproteobacteria bacterium]|jgi:hypothetical protein|nr:hypothetical protein [Deltaproteobacteria bacterium]